ncbi:hypothetical protein [Pseudescherichia sp.]|uniref:hypothetical protein n=1 Tax=Pseudescherichia sp. TaxID=2055881 RepID=UPI00289AFCF6|nr:hypothetical protein [Pseudescherichia sp.]
MIARYDNEEECVFISMSYEEATFCYDALAEALGRGGGEMQQQERDAITDLMGCVNVE